MRCAHRASNGPNHLGLCALQVRVLVDHLGRGRRLLCALLPRPPDPVRLFALRGAVRLHSAAAGSVKTFGCAEWRSQRLAARRGEEMSMSINKTPSFGPREAGALLASSHPSLGTRGVCVSRGGGETSRGPTPLTY